MEIKKRTIAVRSEQKFMKIPEKLVKKVLLCVLKEEKKHGEVSVLFVNDETMTQLNSTYRKKNRTTDVLAFPAFSPLSASWACGPVLGDIVVSVPTAARQARLAGHSVLDEIAFLLIHGMLHLLGYDHHQATERKKMFSRQEYFRGKIA